MQITLALVGLFILAVLILLTKASYDAHHLEDLQKEAAENKTTDIINEKLGLSINYIYTGIIICALLLVYIVYILLEKTIYVGHIQEWMNIIVRWMHITFGIAWIGSSFLFVFMENSLKPNKNRPELKGDMWMVHGGGFFFVEKYQVIPKEIPRELHWFKYEAYFTWLTGFMLLFVVYYFNASAMLVDPNIWDIPSWLGVVIGIGSLALGYLVYDLLCRTPLLKKPLYFGIVGFILLTCFAYGYTQLFNARAAYVHFGALIGTLMAGNVFFVIIPAQKATIAAAKRGESPNPWLGQYAGLRSFHNNYFTLPVLFVMISNHFPSTFGNEYAWAVLAALSLASAGIKHYANLREKGQLSTYVLPLSVLLMLSIAFVTAPQSVGGKCDSEITFTEIYQIFEQRCVSCHSSSPTDDTYTAPPNGVVYDTPQDITKLTDKIMQRVVITKTMPQNNKTGITPEEREKIRCWIEQGAAIGE
jgi:uncharacterized membrane protein